MNILFAGSPYPSAKILDYLTKNSLNKVQAVLTKPDAAKKRGKKAFQSVSYTHLTLPTKRIV